MTALKQLPWLNHLNVVCLFLQIVSFGAGFDTLFFKLKSKNPDLNIAYYELDLAQVVKRKIKCIQQSSKLRQIIGDCLGTKNYYLFHNILAVCTCISIIRWTIYCLINVCYKLVLKNSTYHKKRTANFKQNPSAENRRMQQSDLHTEIT